MKRLRKKPIVKTISMFLLLVMIQFTFAPTISLALTHGPHQPEFTSFEEPGASDLVNLFTGDFAYNIPLLHVPGPEGGFDLPIAYHAGIGVEQEASWVGLGWSLNAGAITRNIVGFPDDASGETQRVSVHDPGIEGKFVKSVFGTYGYRSDIGKYGGMNILGLANYDHATGTVTPNPVGIGSLAIDIGSFGTSTVFTKLITVASHGYNMVNSSMRSFSSPTGMPSVPQEGYWNWNRSLKLGWSLFGPKIEYKIWLDDSRYEKMYGSLYMQDAELQTSATWVRSNVNGQDQTLYQYPQTNNTVNEGAASDILYEFSENEEYKDYSNPVGLAYDNYRVMGQGVSGAIKPYRLDVGSVSVPREMSKKHIRLAPVSFYDYNHYHGDESVNNKIPFVYDGAFSNRYFRHVGGSSEPIDPQNFHFGIGGAKNGSGQFMTYKMSYSDHIFGSGERVASDIEEDFDYKIPAGNHIEWFTTSDIAPSDPQETASAFTRGFIDFMTGDENRRIFRRQGPAAVTHYYESYSALDPEGDRRAWLDRPLVNSTENQSFSVKFYNADNDFVFASGVANPGSYTIIDDYKIEFSADFLSLYLSPGSPPYRTVISHQAPISKAADDKPIEAFTITRADGLTYHYALPIFDYDYESKTINNNDPRKFALIERDEPYANTWLLTTITGSDFVDRNNNGIADEEDWGYWVNFNYGRYDDTYIWRFPFFDSESDDNEITESYVTGKKELYYLDHIQTRTHTAIFFKSLREDGRGATEGGEATDGLGGYTLRLDDIYLLQNKNFDHLKKPTSQGGLGLTKAGGKVWMSNTLTEARREFLKAECLKRISFKYDYHLAVGVPNRANPGGKLKLNEISVYGKNDFKIMPSYKFFYNSGLHAGGNLWGYRGGTYSLSEIHSPLGSMIEIEYEPDTYTSVGGELFPASLNHVSLNEDYDAAGTLETMQKLIYENTFKVSRTVYDRFKVNDAVVLNMTKFVFKTYENGSLCDNFDLSESELASTGFPFSTKVTGKTVSGNHYFLKLGPLPQSFRNIIDGSCFDMRTTEDRSIEYRFTIRDVVRTGGDIRVTKISVTDGMGSTYETRYLYTENTSSTGLSSGVAGLEPIGMPHRTQSALFDHIDYPNMPIVYGKVAVLSGAFKNDNIDDYTDKTVYEFKTPKVASILSQQNLHVEPYSKINEYYIEKDDDDDERHKFYVRKDHIGVTSFGSQIGRVEQVNLIDKNNGLVKTIRYEYGDTAPEYQGVYTESSLMCDLIEEVEDESDDVKLHSHYLKMARTSKKYMPNILLSVQETKYENGSSVFTTRQEFNDWDFYTGQVLVKKITNSMGMKVLSETTPAYTIYPEMGLKAHNIHNKNMLSQTAASASYLLGDSDQKIGLIGASAQTWKEDWANYREFDAEEGEFTDCNESNRSMWRQHQSYVWKGTLDGARDDGTYDLSDFSAFSFTSSANDGWFKAGEVLRYDQTGTPLEMRDAAGILSSNRLGYNKSQVISSASNASYLEAVFSGAEDLDEATGYFGGEVDKGTAANATVNTNSTYVHTGLKSLKIDGAGQGFIYKVDATQIDRSRNYRAAVWVHQQNVQNAGLYYRLNDGAKMTASYDQTMKAGPWYQINISVPVDNSVTQLEVGCENTASGAVYFDDFRFQPIDAGMTASVYNERDQLTHSLDNNNLYVRYGYDDGGQVVETFIEVMDPASAVGEKRVSKKIYNYAGEWGAPAE